LAVWSLALVPRLKPGENEKTHVLQQPNCAGRFKKAPDPQASSALFARHCDLSFGNRARTASDWLVGPSIPLQRWRIDGAAYRRFANCACHNLLRACLSALEKDQRCSSRPVDRREDARHR